MLDGYNRRTDTAHDAGAPGGGKRPGGAGVRNLMGFVDGTANLTTDDDVLDRYVWIADGDGEPAWAVGGSYHVGAGDPDVRRVLGPHPARPSRRR